MNPHTTRLQNKTPQHTRRGRPRRGRSHTACSRPCRWTDPSAAAKRTGEKNKTDLPLFPSNNKDHNALAEAAVRLRCAHQTRVTVVSADESLAEAASGIRVAGVSSGQRAQRVTGTSCTHTVNPSNVLQRRPTFKNLQIHDNDATPCFPAENNVFAV